MKNCMDLKAMQIFESKNGKIERKETQKVSVWDEIDKKLKRKWVNLK